METSTLLLTILTAGICLYYFVLSKLFHYKRLKIPHTRPIPLLGNMASLIFQRESAPHSLRNMYNQFCDAKYYCFYEFTTPTYIIRDPDLINMIAIKNFDSFCDRRNVVNEDIEPMAGRNLLGMRGDHWREMRKLLSPSFTSSKMKMMFELMCHCAKNFIDFLTIESGKTGKTYDMLDILSRYANDVVATCAFGINVDSFKYPNNDFFLLGKEVINFNSPRMLFAFLMHRNFPKIAKLFKLRMFSAKVDKFFKGVVTSTVKARDEQGIVRPDMIQLMMETRNKNHGATFDINEMTAQAFIFFSAGFETVTKTMCFMAHEITVNPDVQRKLREEIDDVLKVTNGKPTYEAINGMKYLDAVVNETLRFYPPSFSTDRICVKEFVLPPATPDSEPLTLKPGDNVWFPIYALHHDSKYYPEPEKFDPDRFLNGKVDNSVYIPFGIGPRLCIGNRFALMEAKIMLFHLLWHCDLELDIKTRNPLVFDKKTMVMMVEGGFWLKLRMRKSLIPVV
ncbi:cytochrome P450 9e2-like [Linepithema humile]|uniref:cytochrome P450 9e2-like n=1 Tax=Linepithema humile TaxID=83485 RepID=UPI000623563F|nr:PREDICTED: cytochrome P450 9e2-like [Linepithema humile]